MDNSIMTVIAPIFEAIAEAFIALFVIVKEGGLWVESEMNDVAMIGYYLALFAVVIAFVWKLLSLLFSIMRYMVFPAVVIALIVSSFSPYTFMGLLPFCAAGCGVILLVKM